MTTLEPDTAVARAKTLLDLGRPEEALPLLATAIASDPDDHRARCLMALALIRLDRDREAFKSAGEAIRIAPEGEWGYRLLSIAAVGIKQPKAAVEAAERAVALEPELAEGRITLATALMAAGRAREAGVEANRAVELDPADPVAHAVVGESALARKDLPVAERAFRRSLELDPEQPVTLNNLGVALIRQGRETEAMKLFESAARSDPRDDLGRRNLATSARRFLAGGGWIGPVGAILVLQVVVRNVVDAKNIDGALAAAIVLGCFLLVFVGMRLYTRGRESELSPATRALLRDERRRMRRRPWTWEPSSRWLPWPIALLFWTPPQLIAVLSGLLFVAMLVSSGGDQWSEWVPLAAIALFTAFFVLRWRDRPRA